MKALGLSLVALATLFAQDPDEGTLSSVKPRIPEPLVFDLIRPLGAERGELEVNTLVRYKPNGAVHWAPEIEYAFAKGYGLEFELPMENQNIETYKVALQGTLPGPWKRKFIHGWQGIGEVARRQPYWQTDALYLAGLRFRPKWSVFSMTGWRAERGNVHGNALLGNYSLFRHQSKNTTFGLETNYKSPGATGRSFLMMPQTHVRASRINVQFGLGWHRAAGRNSPQLALRLSREF
jgi:hypothetical protein